MTTYTTDEANSKVRALYLENLNRPGEAEGVAYYTTLLTNGVTLDQVDSMMEASPEYATLHGGPAAGASNARLWLLGGVAVVLIVIVARRAKK